MGFSQGMKGRLKSSVSIDRKKDLKLHACLNRCRKKHDKIKYPGFSLVAQSVKNPPAVQET